MTKLLRHTSFIGSLRVTLFTMAIALAGGMALQAVNNNLVLITPLLIALPALYALVSDLAIVIAGHTGDPDSTRTTFQKLLKSLVIIVPISATGVFALSVGFSYLRDYTFEAGFLGKYAVFVYVSFTSVVLITLLFSFLLKRTLDGMSLNTDDVLIPVANATASVLMLIAVSIAAWTLF